MTRPSLALMALSCSVGCVAQGADVAMPQPIRSDLQQIIDAARADAALRSGVGVERATLLGSESVTWRDGSLGCPEPGRSYTQALVRGWRIRIEAGGQTHDYHSNLRGQWSWCPPGRAVEPIADPLR